MRNDPVKTLESILKRNGHDVDLRENEVDRYFLFDKISQPHDVDLAWSQFPEHKEIRARAAKVDAVSDIVPGWGYRTPKTSNRCLDTQLKGLVRGHIAAIRPFIPTNHEDILEFLDRDFLVQLLASSPPDPMDNILFLALYEALGEFKRDHYCFDQPHYEVLYDWATYLTKCDEVVLFLLWPILQDVRGIDANTPLPGFELWKYGCRTNYWIKDNCLESGTVYIQPPWRA